MENNVYQIKGLRLNVKDNNVEFNIDEVNIPQDVCLEQLQLIGTIVEKVQACFISMKPAIMATISNNITNGKRMQDREDRRLEDSIKDHEWRRSFESRENDIKDQELTARLRAIEEGYKNILSKLVDENKSAK